MQDACGEVAGSGADFEDYVGLFEGRFGDDGVGYPGVFENVLAIELLANGRPVEGSRMEYPRSVFILNILCAAFAFAAEAA